MKYRKKPIVVDAVQWSMDDGHPRVTIGHRGANAGTLCPDCCRPHVYYGMIRTLESGPAVHYVCPGDWIITGIHGEVYACKPDIFAKTYELVVTAGE